MFFRLFLLMYLDKATEQDLAVSLLTTEVNSSITAPSFNFLAMSALKPSPFDNTCLGFAHDGTVLSPTALSLAMASSSLSKCETTDLFLSHVSSSSTPNLFSRVDLPLPLEPKITPIENSSSIDGILGTSKLVVPSKSKSKFL